MKQNFHRTTRVRKSLWVWVLVTLVAACGSSDDDGGNIPTLIVRGGPILTGDATAPVVEAMAIRDEKIIAVGSEAQINAMVAPETVVLELDGNTALPGFIESHGHYAENAFPFHLANLTTLEPPTKPQLLALLAAEVNNEPDLPLVLSGWVPADYSGTREELDAISSERPIAVFALDGHGMWLNSAAIELGGIPEPADEPLYSGALLRADGTYDGVFIGFQWGLFVGRNLIDQTPPDVLRASILTELGYAASIGVTTIVNMSFAVPVMQILADLAQSGELPVRIREVYDGDDPLSADFAHTLPPGVDSDWFRIQGVKYFADGAPFSGTAAYPSGSGLPSGPLVRTTEELADLIDAAADRGEQVLVHATGQLATHQALDALDAAGEQAKQLRFRIEHADVFYPEDLERLDGLVTSLQPAHFPTFNPPGTEGLVPPAAEYGQLRYLEAGATVVLGGDGLFSPTDWMAMSMEGPTPEEAFTFEQALAAMTTRAAYATFDENRTGTLAPGFLADFTVVDADPRGLSALEMYGLKVVRTVVGGETQFVAP